ncbi:MAG: ABC transporter [Candidatus Nitrosocaldaceae archaeon]|nr:MAG: ABC transporter [Candidatus Nitrosocaldaceae archaeon]
MYAVETRDLVRIFRSKREQQMIKALDNVNLTIKEGEIFGLLGANGAGKTTLVKILSTLLLPTDGKAYVHGYDVVEEADKVRRVINLVSGGETPGYGILTVRENLWFFSQIYGIHNAKDKIDILLRDMELEEYADIRMHKLSTGYKQRLNLARGFINEPQILFLDEPTLGLDVLNAKHIRNYVRDWVKNSNKSVLLTTHYMAEADEICDRVAIIFKGKIIACDTPKRLKESIADKTSAVIEIKNNGIKIDRIDGMEGLALENHDGITRVKVLLDEQSSISRLVSYLTNNGYNISSIKMNEPTLEDVYIKYVGMSLDDKQS